MRPDPVPDHQQPEIPSDLPTRNPRVPPARVEIPSDLPAQNPERQPICYADDLFWIMFNDRTGKLICQQHVAGLGLAAAMLIELADGGWVTAEDSKLRAVRHRVPPRDAASHVLLEQITSEPKVLTVRQWLDFLSKDAVDRIHERLVRAQTLIREERQRTFRSPVYTYAAANNNDAAWPRARLSTFVRQGQDLNSLDLVLTALCDATGLLRLVLEDFSKHEYDALVRHVDAYLMDGHRSMWAIVRGLEDELNTRTAALA